MSLLCLRRTRYCFSVFFFFNAPAPTEIYTLSLHDALPIWLLFISTRAGGYGGEDIWASYREHTHDDFAWQRSEEHTSELQSLTNLVCRLLLEKKKKKHRKKEHQTLYKGRNKVAKTSETGRI